MGSSPPRGLVETWCQMWVVGVDIKPSDDCPSGHETMVMVAKVDLILVGWNQ